MTEHPWTICDPLDVWCPTCHAAPSIRCTWTDAEGESFSREAHAARVASARVATWVTARRKARQQPPSSSA